MPDLRLMLVGDTAEHFDVRALAMALGLADRVIVTGFVGSDQLGSYLHASDICLCLRWPSGRETSASWLRCLAAGRPTVITDLAHVDDVPSYDPRSWNVLPPFIGEGAPEGALRANACAVSIDLLDEVHSLTIALRRLAHDRQLRDRLGRAARFCWEQCHTVQHMADDYWRVMARAVELSVARPEGLPPHLITDGRELMHDIAREAGVQLDL
jgi:glycosyltransferase involved in cell wall biosynthesis